MRAGVPSICRRPGRLRLGSGGIFEVLVSDWEIRNALHRLMVRTIEFETGIKSDEPDWDTIWEHHLELCRIEEYLQLRED